MIALSLWLAAQPVLELPPELPPVETRAASPSSSEPLSSSSDSSSSMGSPTSAASAASAAVGIGIGEVAEYELVRGLQDARLRAGHTVVGGYGQINGTALAVGPGDDGEVVGNFTYQASVRRLVLFLAHSFDAGVKIYTELEWENAIACATCVGSVEIEQAFVEMPLLKTDAGEDALALRGGLILVPMGILNQWHEPPVFHGVERSRVEEGGVIPSTWRELGVGLTGRPWPGVRGEAYVTTGLDPTRLRDSGLLAARSNGGLAPAHSLQAVARLELEPVLGAVVGASGLAGDLGGAWLGTRPFAAPTGAPLSLTLPLYAADVDARIRKDGLEARALAVAFFLPNSGDLMQARRPDGSALFPVDKGGTGALPTRMLGAQLEVAWDVLRLGPMLGAFDTEQQLLPFVRLDFYQGQSAVPDGFLPDPRFDVREATVGLSWRPIQQVVVKADVQARNRRLGLDEAQGNVGLGFMF